MILKPLLWKSLLFLSTFLKSALVQKSSQNLLTAILTGFWSCWKFDQEIRKKPYTSKSFKTKGIPPVFRENGIIHKPFLSKQLKEIFKYSWNYRINILKNHKRSYRKYQYNLWTLKQNPITGETAPIKDCNMTLRGLSHEI